MITLNLADVSTFETLPEGVYTADVYQVERTVAKSSGADMVTVTYKIVDDKYNGRRLYENFVLTEKALWKTAQFLDVVGVDRSSLTAVTPDDIAELLEQTLGSALQLKVGVRDWNGREQNNVTGYLPL